MSTCIVAETHMTIWVWTGMMRDWKHRHPLDVISCIFSPTLGSFYCLEEFQPLLGINYDRKARTSVFLMSWFLLGDII